MDNPPLQIIELWNFNESECCICGKYIIRAKKAIAMFEGLPVPNDWNGDWAGFDACDECFEKNNRSELKMWNNDGTIKELKNV